MIGRRSGSFGTVRTDALVDQRAAEEHHLRRVQQNGQYAWDPSGSLILNRMSAYFELPVNVRRILLNPSRPDFARTMNLGLRLILPTNDNR